MPSRQTLKIIGLVLAIAVLIIVPGLLVRSCDSRHNKAAQTAVEHAQSGAASNSAADAVGTVAASGEAERASEDLTRNNEQQIRAAPGANDKVNPAVRDAGISALCRRHAYANDPRCHPRP